MQLVVDERWSEDDLIKFFNQKCAKYGIKKECYRRRFFINPRDKAKRNLCDSVSRKKKKDVVIFTHRPNRDEEPEEKKKVLDDDGDNWELPDEELPEHDYLLSISQTNNRWDNDERGRTSNFQSDDSTLPLGAFGNKKKGKWNK